MTRDPLKTKPGPEAISSEWRSRVRLREITYWFGTASMLVVSATVTFRFDWLMREAQRPLFWPLIFVFVLSFMAVLLSDPYSKAARIFEQEAQVLDARAEAEETLVDYVEALLRAGAKHQEASARRAGGRANVLSLIGSFLMGASVLAPLVFVALYVNLSPTTTSSGTAPARDWHLLLAGVSFGLLFIAAARGILLAESRQRDVYAREVRETSYFGDLRRALGIAQRLDREDQDAKHTATREVVRKIMALMLERGGTKEAPSVAAVAESASLMDGQHEVLKIVSDVIKK